MRVVLEEGKILLEGEAGERRRHQVACVMSGMLRHPGKDARRMLPNLTTRRWMRCLADWGGRTFCAEEREISFMDFFDIFSTRDVDFRKSSQQTHKAFPHFMRRSHHLRLHPRGADAFCVCKAPTRHQAHARLRDPDVALQWVCLRKCECLDLSSCFRVGKSR